MVVQNKFERPFDAQWGRSLCRVGASVTLLSYALYTACATRAHAPFCMATRPCRVPKADYTPHLAHEVWTGQRCRSVDSQIIMVICAILALKNLWQTRTITRLNHSVAQVQSWSSHVSLKC